MLSRIASHYQGAYTIPELMKLKYREMKFWYDIGTREIVEDNILNDFRSKNKPLPSSMRLKSMVDKKLKGS